MNVIKMNNRKAFQSGQVMSEYAITLAMFTAVALVVMMLLAVFTEYGWRIVSLVALEYP